MKRYYYLRASCSINGQKAYYIYYTDPMEPYFDLNELSYKEAKALTSIEADNIIKSSTTAWEKIEGKVKTIKQIKFI